MRYVKDNDFIVVEYNEDHSIKQVIAYPDSWLVSVAVLKWQKVNNFQYMRAVEPNKVLIYAINRGYKPEKISNE